jgi:hypothetical protein
MKGKHSGSPRVYDSTVEQTQFYCSGGLGHNFPPFQPLPHLASCFTPKRTVSALSFPWWAILSPHHGKANNIPTKWLRGHSRALARARSTTHYRCLDTTTHVTRVSHTPRSLELPSGSLSSQRSAVSKSRRGSRSGPDTFFYHSQGGQELYLLSHSGSTGSILIVNLHIHSLLSYMIQAGHLSDGSRLRPLLKPEMLTCFFCGEEEEIFFF